MVEYITNLKFINFMSAVFSLRGQYSFSVTSWIRSQKRNKEVGGIATSYHLSGLAIDVILDNNIDKDSLVTEAKRIGLNAIDEGDHVHLEVTG